MTPGELVTKFCTAWGEGDPTKLAAYFTDEATYHNMPMKPIVGRQAIEAFLVEFTGAFGGIDFEVHHQVAAGDVVLNERTDRFHLGGAEIVLPVMGTFEVHDGKIHTWRDYFDLTPVNRALEEAAP